MRLLFEVVLLTSLGLLGSGAALQDSDKLEQTLKEALLRDPADFHANHALGELYLRQGKLREGIPYLAKARDIDPQHYANGFDLALAHLKTGQFSLARIQIESMLRSGDSAELRNLLADLEEMSGNHEAAAREYHRAAELDPSEKNLFDLGSHLTRYSASEPAISTFRFGIQRHPRSSLLRVGLGVALYSAHRYDEAVQALLAAVDLDPADQRPLLFLGKIADVSQDMAGQLADRLAEIVRRYPTSAAAHYCYAVILWGKGGDEGSPQDLQQVEQLLKTAISLDSTLYDAHFRLGVLYQQEDKFEPAIEAYEQAMTLEPEHYAPHYRLAQIYRRIGESANARQHLEAYTRLRKRATTEVNDEKP